MIIHNYEEDYWKWNPNIIAMMMNLREMGHIEEDFRLLSNKGYNQYHPELYYEEYLQCRYEEEYQCLVNKMKEGAIYG